MIMGHYAVALVPYSRMQRTAPFWLLLVFSQLQDFVSLSLTMLGIERVRPTSFMDVSFKALHLEIRYSHVITIEILMAIASVAVVAGIWRRRDLALWCGALVLLHEACDLLSGWSHAIVVGGPLVLGLNLYSVNPYLAFVIELVLITLLVTWYVRDQARQGHPFAGRARSVLYAGFLGGMLMYVPLATISLRQILDRLG